MRMMVRAGYFLGLVVLLVGCAGVSPSQRGTVSFGFDQPPWANGSTANYEWLDQSDAQIGTSQFSFSLGGGIWTISETDSVAGTDQTVEMRLDETNLAPLSETKVITTATSHTQIDTQYQGRTLEIQSIVDGKTETSTLSIPLDTIDNDQLLMTLRALPFHQGYHSSYALASAQGGQTARVSVTVQASETISVPAGSFETWPVQIQVGQATQTAWYQLADPHLLVKYDNGTDQMELTAKQP